MKPTDYKLVIFQSKEQQFVLPTNKIRKEWNPFSIVYCVSVDFPDYLFSNVPYKGMINKSMSMTEDISVEIDIS